MTKTQSELMRDEFGEGFDHLRMGAAHAAGTAAGLIAPRLDSMRERLEPAFEKSMEKSKDKVRASARRANMIARRATGKKKETRTARRWPMVIGGLMIAGAVAGAAGALLSRRRQKMWNEYGTTTDFRDDTRNIADSTGTTASSVAEAVKDKAGNDVLGQMKNTTDTKPTKPTTTTSSPSPGSRNGRP